MSFNILRYVFYVWVIERRRNKQEEIKTKTAKEFPYIHGRPQPTFCVGLDGKTRFLDRIGGKGGGGGGGGRRWSRQ